MKTVVVTWNNVRHVREVHDDVPEEEVIKQVIADKQMDMNGSPEVPLDPEELTSIPEPGVASKLVPRAAEEPLATVVEVGRTWYRVHVNGKDVGGKAMRRAEADEMARQVNLTKINPAVKQVIGG